MEYYQNYTEEPERDARKTDAGTAPMVLGILSIISSITISRIVGLVLGIVAICLSSGIRKDSGQASAGFVMGIVGVCISAVLLALMLLPLILLAVFSF